MSTTRALLVGALLVGGTAAIELALGRLPLGPDGRFAMWETDIWSAAMSQRFADPYSFSHVLHGVLFYAALWIAAPRAAMATRVLAAVALECGWEVLENSPVIIDRYREATIAQGYEGDSVLNSMGDIVMMAVGFALASRLPVRHSVALVLVVEIGMLAALRDNLTLNIVMLAWPIEAIREWQMVH